MLVRYKEKNASGANLLGISSQREQSNIQLALAS
jgi:hypothetical protein